MKSSTLHNNEFLALTLTAASKFLFMDILNWRLFYITGISIFWLSYVVIQVRKVPRVGFRWGFHRNHLKETFVFLSLPTIAAILSSVVYGMLTGRAIISWHILPILLLYPLWGIVQQFLMLGILYNNLSDMFGSRLNRYVLIIIVSLLFSAIHYPDLFLMILTFGMEIVFITVYLRWRNLWAIGIVHGWIATFALFFVQERDLWAELFRMF